MKTIFNFIISTVIGGMLFTASAQESVWTQSKESPVNIRKNNAVSRQTFPKEFALFELNIRPLRRELFSIVGRNGTSTVISLPNADGGLEQFEVFEASNFEPDLQAKFPEIRAYSGRGITDRYASL